MIPIKIEGKKYKIKPIKDLTVKEIIDLNEIEEMNLVKYIAWSTGKTFEESFFVNLSESVRKQIGTFDSVENIPQSKKYSNYSLDTVGQRYQVEASKKTGYDLVVFVLAVAICRSTNIDDVNKKVDELYAEPYREVLPTGVFFLRRLQSGNNKGLGFLRKMLMFLRTARTARRQAQND